MSLSASRPHGYSRYRLDGCRCYVCGFAVSEYEQRRRARLAHGTWHPFTDATRARLHIDSLRTLGYGDRSVAVLAQVTRKVVRDIRTGIRHNPGRGNPPLTKIRTETAAAILAVPLSIENLPDGTRVDATATWGLIEALLARGWSKAAIAREAGLGRSIQIGHDSVTARTARRIESLHERAAGPLDVESVELLIDTDTAESVAHRMGLLDVRELTRALYRAGRFDLAGRLNRYAA